MAQRLLSDSLQLLERVDDMQLFRKVFDSLPEHVALLDREGNIIATNHSWNAFMEENQGANAHCVDRVNYIAVAEKSRGVASDEAHTVARGLKGILSGDVGVFEIEYPCHSPTEKRWFLMFATPIVTDGRIEGAVVSHINITQRRVAEDALRESEDRFSSAFEYAAIGKALVSVEGRFLKVNKALCDLVGYTEAELLGLGLRDITFPDDQEKDLDPMQRLLEGDIPSFQLEKRYVSRSGKTLWGLLSVSVVRGVSRKPKHLIFQIQDINDRKQLEEELVRQSITDPLTGAPNRRFFVDRTREEVARKKRHGAPLCVAILDIDKFKEINDTYGHEAGDHVLKAMTAKSLELLREIDVFGRIGGEEFAIAMVQTSRDDVLLVAERLRHGLSQLAVPTGKGIVRFTVSIGMHMVTSEDTIDTALQAADIALYEAKGAGRNRVCMQ
jgi:diguanylate cyclase (GGDEF)-like protein/PAS domain S-box-containing protein